MDIRKIYDQIGDFDGICGRLPAMSIIEKFTLKFLDDDSFKKLEKAMERKDAREAFRAVHTLKGVAGNMAFTKLFEAAAALTEELREKEDISGIAYELFDAVKDRYAEVTETIRVNM